MMRTRLLRRPPYSGFPAPVVPTNITRPKLKPCRISLRVPTGASAKSRRPGFPCGVD